MERRALLAIALSVGILLVWQAFFVPAPPAPPRGQTPPSGSAPGVTPPPESAAIALVPRPQATGGKAGAGVDVSTPLYRATFGSDGVVTAWTLHYRGVKPLVVGEGPGPLAVGIAAPGGAIDMVPLRPDRNELALTAGTGTVMFRGVTQGGVRVSKALEFRADSYLVGVQLDLEAGPRVTGPVTLALYWTSPVAHGGSSAAGPTMTLGEGPGHAQLLGRILVAPDGGVPIVFEAPAPAVKDAKEAAGTPELKEPRLVPAAFERATRGWAALENDYFIASLIGGGGRLLRARDRDVSEVALVFPDVRLEPGGTWTARGRAYVGPKEWERLKAVGAGLEEAQARNYGHFLWLPWIPMWWFCVPLLWLLNFFGTQVPGQNYGVAIILLTVLVKGLFYPLSHKSMSSMKQMQGLQPQLNALRAKYKSDPQRFQREQMALFRTHKVNPMGGCLPMVVQIPIFYALYLTLQYSVELQGAHFLLWIADLSKKDPYYVLPILMGVSMLVQQKMTPTVGDPRQAKVMLIMPVIFTFMFLEFPTGLVLYWLVNNVLSVTQQALIDRAIRARARPAVVEAKSERPAR